MFIRVNFRYTCTKNVKNNDVYITLTRKRINQLFYAFNSKFPHKMTQLTSCKLGEYFFLDVVLGHTLYVIFYIIYSTLDFCNGIQGIFLFSFQKIYDYKVYDYNDYMIIKLHDCTHFF